MSHYYAAVQKRVAHVTDPVHGNIFLESFQQQIFSLPHFQRLDRVRQLGVAQLVYPSATNTRLAHCIGVGHLSGKLFDNIIREQVDVGARMSKTDRKLVITAGMCHDLGHAPFSHAWETFSQQNGVDFCHERMSVRLIRDACDKGLLPFLDEEPDGDDVRRGVDEDAFLKTTLERRERRLKVIEWLICGTKAPLPSHHYESAVVNDDSSSGGGSNGSNGGKRGGDLVLAPHKRWILDIVHNSMHGVDVDRMDYLERDALFVFGAGRSSINIERILLSMRVVGERICFHRNVAFNVYQLLRLRFDLHRTVYAHRKCMAVEVMLFDILSHVAKVESIGIFEKTKYGDAFLLLDDSLLQIVRWKALEYPNDENLQRATQIMDMLSRRELYECVGAATFDSASFQKIGGRSILDELLRNVKKRVRLIDENNIDHANPHTPVVLTAASSSSSESSSASGVQSSLVCNYHHFNFGYADSNPLQQEIFFEWGDSQPRCVEQSEVSHLQPMFFGEHQVLLFVKQPMGELLAWDKRAIQRAFAACVQEMTSAKSVSCVLLPDSNSPDANRAHQ